MASAEAARSAGTRPPPPPPPAAAPRPRPPAQVLLLAAALALALATPVHTQSCDPDADATYTAAVLEYSPALGVTLENAAERFRQNVQNYVAYAKEAKRQGAEIVVFPECGLATLELPRLPDSSPAVALPLPPVGANPCVEQDVHHAQELRDLSCAARDAGIYVVVNLPEVERCFPALSFCPECPGFQPHAVRSGIVACNTDGRRYFNSDVAFDRKGTVVARYRKYNLFGEAGFVPPAEPTLAHFDADFGVRFGLFTCFDLMFEQPAVTLVTEAGVSDVVFPTAWFSELPFLTAVQAQAAWAWVLDVNFLGAGYNLPEVGSTGTGLYAGRRGKVVATMERERTNKLLVGRLPNRNACSHNATAAAHLAGKIVVLARKADTPAPRAPPPPAPSSSPAAAPGKCVNSLPATNPKIPSLYQCHLQSLLQLKEPGAEVEEEDAVPPVDIHQLKVEVERLLFPAKNGEEKQLQENDTPSLGDTVDTMRKKLEDMAAPGAGAGVGGSGVGALSAEEDGYLYLKTEDLADYVTVLLPAAAPDPTAYENSSLKVCHDSFCCHFQVVMSVQRGEGAAEDEREGAGEGEDEGAGEGRADEAPFGSGEDTEGVGFVRAARRAPVGGSLAKHFIIPEGEEEDYLEDDEDDEGGGGDDEDDEEDEAFAPDREEMEPTEDEFDDDEEVQMDTSAEFSIDPVLLKASGIGHYGPGQVFKETVDQEDMEPSEDTIRAQAIADEKQAEEMKEMQAQMPGVAAPEAAPEVPPEAATEEVPEPAPEPVPEAAPEAAPEAVPAAVTSREDQRYYYRVAVFNGRRTFDGITDGGLQVCAVIPCTGVTPDTCGKLHQFPSDLALTTFRYVRISGRFARVRSLPLPSTLDAALLPLPADAFSLTASVRRKETDIVMETHKPVNFLTFGIYNRNFANDPERQPSIG